MKKILFRYFPVISCKIRDILLRKSVFFIRNFCVLIINLNFVKKIFRKVLQSNKMSFLEDLLKFPDVFKQ